MATGRADVSRGKLLGWVASRLGIPRWGQVLIGALIVSLPLVWLSLTSKIEKLSEDFGEFSKNQSAFQQKLIERLLDKALSEIRQGKPESAAPVLSWAQGVVSAARESRVPAQDEFFQSAITRLNKLSVEESSQEITDLVFAVRVDLSTYRSAIEQKPRLHGAPLGLVTAVNAANATVGIPGTVLNCKAIKEPFDCVIAPGPALLSRDIRIEDVTFVDARLTLDGINWKRVAFVNSHIKYLGGEIALDGARFINCTFDLAPTSSGIDFANTVALGQGTFIVGRHPFAMNVQQ